MANWRSNKCTAAEIIWAPLYQFSGLVAGAGWEWLRRSLIVPSRPDKKFCRTVDVSAGSPTCCVLRCGTDGGTKAKPPVSPLLAALLSLKTPNNRLCAQRRLVGRLCWIDFTEVWVAIWVAVPPRKNCE